MKPKDTIKGHKMATLKLTAHDHDDLIVLSSLLQDATVLVGDMGYDADAHQFMMVAARFMQGEDGGNHRRLVGVNFDQVKTIKRKGFSPKDRDDVLNLLAIHAEGDHIDVIFAGAAMVRLECDAIRVYAADLGEGWSTGFQPQH